MKHTNKLSIYCASILSIAISTTATADAIVKDISGKVYSTNTSKVKPTVLDQRLKPGDQFSTGENGRVILVINENCRVEVPPLHFVRIKDLESCPTATPLKGASVACNCKGVPTGTGGGSVAAPLIFGAAVVAAIVHDNRKSSPD